jgi:hypothetical protein
MRSEFESARVEIRELIDAEGQALAALTNPVGRAF